MPTTPNPTTGFLIFIPEPKIIHLDRTVADAIKTIVSLGAVTPDYVPGAGTGSPINLQRS